MAFEIRSKAKITKDLRHKKGLCEVGKFSGWLVWFSASASSGLNG